MSYDDCAGDKLVTGDNTGECPVPTETELPGNPFFKDISNKLNFRPSQRNYGISVTDLDQDGHFEFLIAGNGYRNLAYKYNFETETYDEIADETLQDSSRKAIGLAACDIDGNNDLFKLNFFSGFKVTVQSTGG